MLSAQTVQVYSEFQRPDPFGGVVAPDRAWHPREILSPGIGRNGHATFHVAITVPKNESYWLFVIPNPPESAKVSVYKEHFTQTPAGWIPDRLTELERLPDYGVMPDPDDGIEGQTTRVYLVDLWVPPDRPIFRFRLEIQVKVADWIIYPMEIRVVTGKYPEIDAGEDDRPLPPIERGADAPFVQVVGDYAAGRELKMPDPGLTVRGFLRRNAIQDVSLGGRELWLRALDFFRANTVFSPRPWGAEWCLRLRDMLLNGKL